MAWHHIIFRSPTLHRHYQWPPDLAPMNGKTVRLIFLCTSQVSRMPTNDQRLDYAELVKRPNRRYYAAAFYAGCLSPLTAEHYPTDWWPFRNILQKLCSKGNIGNNRAFFGTLSELGNAYLKETRDAEKYLISVSLKWTVEFCSDDVGVCLWWRA